MISEEKKLPVPWLDGLRGLAILLVLSDHFFNQYYVFTGGWIGVNLFFILSGYLITGRLYAHEAANGGRHYFRNFYGRRILRIFPVYYACLIVFFGLLPYVYSRYFYFFGELYREQWWYWSYLSNWRMALYGIPTNAMLITLWSLAVEEQFYLLWPFIFRRAASMNRKKVIMLLWGASIAYRISAQSPELSYFNTLTAAEPLLMGALMAILEKEGKLTGYRKLVIPLILPAILVLAIIISRDNNLTNRNVNLMRWGYTFIDVLLAGLLYLLAAPGKGTMSMRYFFSRKWIRWLGKYSYGIYMYHWFVLQMLAEKSMHVLEDRGMQAEAAYLLSRAEGLILVLACSYASYHLFEKRFLRLKKYFA